MPSKKQYEDSLTDMKAWMKLQPVDIQKELTIVSSEESDKPFMLHIDRNEIDAFIPRVGQSFEDDENKTIPRVTVAPTLVGCILGYARCINDFMLGHNISKKESPDDMYRQGYKIHHIDYLHCLQPTFKMVWDGEETKEHWLVNYQPKAKEYIPKVVGEFYFTQMTFEALKGAKSKRCADTTVRGYLKHDDPAGIQVYEGVVIPAGTYSFVFELGHLYNPDGKAVSRPQSIESCDAGEYAKNKKLYAALLSAGQPSFLKW
jgi:hypothetical protein